MKASTLLAAFLAFAAPSMASAVNSIEGLWWDPSIVGEGWTIDIQGDVAAVTWYRYDDGEPSFRTSAAEVTYEQVDLGLPGEFRVHLEGEMYRTENFVDDTNTGAFEATFHVKPGELTAVVRAEDVERALVPFNYSYHGPADKVRGAWVLSQIGDGEISNTTVMAEFVENAAPFPDGTRARPFVTSKGDNGTLFYDSAQEAFVLSVAYEDGTYLVALVEADEVRGAGFGARFDAEHNEIGERFFVAGHAVARSKDEVTELVEVVGDAIAPAPHATKVPALNVLRTAAAKLNGPREM